LLTNQNGIDVNETSSGSWTPLLISTYRNHVEIVQALLTRKDIDVNQTRGKDNITALFQACENGSVDIVQLLLSTHHTVDLNCAIRTGATSLYAACQNGHVDVVRLLLSQSEILVNEVDDDGDTALYVAAVNGHVEVVRCLLSHRDILLNKALHDGQSPLFGACESGHVEIVLLFLEAGADVGIRVAERSSIDSRCSGLTAAGIARNNGHVKIVQLLQQQDQMKATTKE